MPTAGNFPAAAAVFTGLTPLSVVLLALGVRDRCYSNGPDVMPEKTPCIHCRTVGFVRWENVIKAGVAYRDYFCGHCERSWRIVQSDEDDRRDDTDDRREKKTS